MLAPLHVRAARGLLIAAAVLALLALVAEATLRSRHARTLAALAATETTRDRYLCMESAEDPVLLYRLAPGRCGANSRGYLYAERTLHKPPDTMRIVVVGDSVAAGSGVHREERFAQVLEYESPEWLGHPVEVILLARSGYSTSQELVLLEREAYDYAPDLVVISYVLNDPAHPIYHDANGAAGAYFHRPSSHVLHTLRASLFGLRERWRGRSCPSEYHERLHCVYREAVRKNLAEVARISRARDVPALLVIHPVIERGHSYAEYALTAVHTDLRALADEAGLPVLDLLDAYRDRAADEISQVSPLWDDPWHPNALGHRLAAEAIGAHLAAGPLAPRP